MTTNINFPTYGFINNVLALSEENWRRFFKPFITDSVQNGLATTKGTGMTVNVSAGECRCGAVMGILDEMIALDLEYGDTTYNRIDSVIVQYSYNEPSTLSITTLQGTPSANPVPPSLSKIYDTLWQMEIAQILVPSGATSSSSLTITDKRVIYESIESIIDDNAENDTNHVWSASKTYNEISSLSDEINNIIDNDMNKKAPAIEETVSGDIVYVEDAAEQKVKDLTVAIEPVQDLHGYDGSWLPNYGNNLIPDGTDTEKGYLADSYLKNDGTIGSGGYYNISEYFPVEAGTLYGLKKYGSYTANIPSVCFYDSSKNFISGEEYQNRTSFTITSPANAAYARTTIITRETTKILFVKGSTFPDVWEPYSNICPISGHTETNIFADPKYGGCITWNQLVKNGNFESTSSWSNLRSTLSVQDNVLKIQGNGTDSNNGIYQNANIKIPLEHIFLGICEMKADVTGIKTRMGMNYGDFNDNAFMSENENVPTSWTTFYGIIQSEPFTNYGFGFRVSCPQNSRIPDDSYLYLKNAMIIDLTAVFGETVANQIYTMEQIEAGTGLAFIKNLFPADYYAYNTGTKTCVSAVNGDPYRLVTIDLNGIRYGGTLDMTTGMLTVDRAMVELDGITSEKTLDRASSLNTDPQIKNAVFWCSSQSGAYFVDMNTKCGLLCDKLTEITDISAYSKVNSALGCFIYAEQASNPSISHQPRIAIPKTMNILSISEANQWVQDIGGLTFVYKLAAPYTVQLTAHQLETLLGKNNIWADTGDVEVTYRADTKTYIDNTVKASALATRSMITGVETSMVASKNYVVNDLLIVGDNLYKVTANIANGGTIAVGTNVASVTLAEYILSLQ